MGNISFNIIDDSFHFDYMMASIAALFWLRCIVLLRLSETFGPLLVMIVAMVKVMVTFFVLYFLGLLTFASVGTLTLAESTNFRDLFAKVKAIFTLHSFKLSKFMCSRA